MRRRRSNSNDEQILTATFWILVIAQTIGSVDMPGRGARKMPAPRAYVAIVSLWAILSFIADLGASKLASRMGIVVALTGTVIGPFGQRFVSLMDDITTMFAASTPVGVGASSALSQTPTGALPPL